MIRQSTRSLKRKKYDDDDDDDGEGGSSEDDEYTFSGITGVETSTNISRSNGSQRLKNATETAYFVESEEDKIRADNPLPGFIDPITLEEVIKPAISPYGHVMGYSPFSWISLTL